MKKVALKDEATYFMIEVWSIYFFNIFLLIFDIPLFMVTK